MGKIEKSTSFNKTKGTKIEAFCGSCMRVTSHLVLQSVDVDGFEMIGEFQGVPETIDWSGNYQIIRCGGCEEISFRHKSWCSEDQGMGCDGQFDDGAIARLYPHRSEQTRQIKDYYSVPSRLRGIYTEMLECFNSGMPTLCAAGLRAVIEGVCVDLGVVNGLVRFEKDDGSVETKRRKDLLGKISGLSEKGFMTGQNAELLHEHRFLGNEAVHQLARPTRKELGLAIDIVEHLLDSLYELPGKGGELKRLRVERVTRGKSKVAH